MVSANAWRIPRREDRSPPLLERALLASLIPKQHNFMTLLWQMGFAIGIHPSERIIAWKVQSIRVNASRLEGSPPSPLTPALSPTGGERESKCWPEPAKGNGPADQVVRMRHLSQHKPVTKANGEYRTPSPRSLGERAGVRGRERTSMNRWPRPSFPGDFAMTVRQSFSFGMIPRAHARNHFSGFRISSILLCIEART
jgi:hypothetical protein